MGRRVWRYPAEHVEKLTALCAEKLATQRDAAKQAKSERDAAARAAQRAARRAAKKLVKAARRDRAGRTSAGRTSAGRTCLMPSWWTQSPMFRARSFAPKPPLYS